MEQLVKDIENAAAVAKGVYERVSREKAEEAALRAKEHKEAQALAKKKRIKNIVGDIPKKIAAAANNGISHIDIRVDSKDVVQTAYSYEYVKSFKVGSASYEAYEFLLGIPNITVIIREDKQESTGAYGERECWSDFYIRVTF